MSTLGLIPARGGSKGIPRKNIKSIAGKPLIAWTIEAALRSSLLEAVVVSTEDEEIAEIAQHFGALVPFMRPASLARDGSPGLDPIMHALDQLPAYDSVLLLQPTSPLRRTEDIDRCLQMAHQQSLLSIVSVVEADNHPYWTYQIDENNALRRLVDAAPVTRRQDLPPTYVLNGALYFADVKWLRQSRTLLNDQTRAVVMAREYSIDIDTPLDWRIAEMLLKELR